jgi:hypothetical protein
MNHDDDSRDDDNKPIDVILYRCRRAFANTGIISPIESMITPFDTLITNA